LFLKVRKIPSRSTPILSQIMGKPQIVAALGRARLETLTNAPIPNIVQTRTCKRLRVSAVVITVHCLIIATFYSELPIHQFRQDPRDLRQLLAVKVVFYSLVTSQKIWSCPRPSNKMLEFNGRHHTEFSLSLHPLFLIHELALTEPRRKPARKIFRCFRVVGS
jgi:hypothetical protein